MATDFPDDIIGRLASTRIVAGFSAETPDEAVAIACALLDGGVDALEVTLRTPQAVAGIEAIAKALPQVLLGVGTILSEEQVHAVKAAGAAFGVAPGLSLAVMAAARQVRLPFAPGVLTPSDVTAAVEHGATFVKLFPAEAAGGVEYLRSLAAPFASRGVRYFPFGGINAQNMNAYLEVPSVVAVGGTWITSAGLIQRKDWKGIARQAELTRAALVGESK